MLRALYARPSGGGALAQLGGTLAGGLMSASTAAPAAGATAALAAATPAQGVAGPAPSQPACSAASAPTSPPPCAPHPSLGRPSSWLPAPEQLLSHAWCRGSSSGGATASAAAAAVAAGWRGLATKRAAAAAAPSGSRARRDAPEDDDGLIRVIMRQDVKGVGRRGDVVAVKRGRMRHALYPGGQAAYATPDNLALYELSPAERAARDAEDRQKADVLPALLKALARKPVVVTRRPSQADPERFADAPVSSAAIVEAVRRQLGIALHPSHVLLGPPIDAYGSFRVPLNLRLPDDAQIELTCHVDRRTGRGAPAAAASGGATAAAPGAAAAAAPASAGGAA